MKIDLNFFANSVVLFAMIIALTGFKVFSCKPFDQEGEDFDWRKLLIGLSANFGVILLLSFVYFVGAFFGADLAVIQIGEAKYTIQAALNALIILAIGVYGIKVYKNAVKFFKLDNEAKNDVKVVSEMSRVVDYNVSTNDYENKSEVEVVKG